MNSLHVAMTGTGLLLHFLTRYGEFWRNPATPRPTPWGYVLQDPVAWSVAAIGAGVSYVALPELGPLVGLSATPAGSFAAGYIGSSLSAKLPAILAHKLAGIR
jgi:hypothetical protein